MPCSMSNLPNIWLKSWLSWVIQPGGSWKALIKSRGGILAFQWSILSWEGVEIATPSSLRQRPLTLALAFVKWGVKEVQKLRDVGIFSRGEAWLTAFATLSKLQTRRVNIGMDEAHPSWFGSLSYLSERIAAGKSPYVPLHLGASRILRT